MTVTNKSIEQLSVDTIRTLSIDAVEKAKSGHPGMPMGSAPMGYELFAKLMKHYPEQPNWINRDRFVLSAGHGSMLLYSLLHLSGYDLSMEELKNFRQWGSKTPGHPEVGHTPGVDATTGPLGQGFGMAVGMAMAEAHLAAVYNRDSYRLIDHYTYAICGDGDLMEGISSESASLAGHLKLGKLIVLYDSNDISLDGELNLSFSENVAQRFEGYGWQVLRVEDGNDLQAIHKAVLEAQADYRPTLIEVKTVIGYGSPNKAGKGGHVGPHGSPLGTDEVALTKKAYGWDDAQHFHVPDEVRKHFEDVKRRNGDVYEGWNAMFAEYAKAYPELAKQFEIAVKGDLPEGWDKDISEAPPAEKGTRTASGIVLNEIAKHVPYLVGGSADLESSTMTHMKDLGVMTAKDYSGQNIYYGVREFGMGAAVNGMLLHGGLKVFGGTFFVFSDYLRPAIRLASIMNVPAIYVFTHDSIGVGEDGPTHEPIEQLAALRVIPGVTVIRPADGSETAAAWRYAVENKSGPVALIFSRQAAQKLEGSEKGAVDRGAYVLADAPGGKPQAQIIATGTEVQLAVAAQKQLAEEGVAVRVISMPSWELFDKQTQEYKDSVILPDVKARLAVEMGHSFGWERYVGDQGDVLGINKFGASAPGPIVIREYGFTVENVVARVKQLL
ncbi:MULTISPECIES: transketolase [unclassified Paenibacillus]|uniref:transketolase n=1 Tax=unclassified Paenibacillus TaxID=185978 RepID=UPI001AE8990C|nr:MULTISPECIES: transketolase [unclassified Paenibacillus]MBP1157432.1 transketolase [Paenibacillus sp. PvP091]MBP1171830.1 transketolase [Paenibacillus sp. PvR098]MBP2438211.1 transketolase [Paenibacillus sp. PvP052]